MQITVNQAKRKRPTPENKYVTKNRVQDTG